MEERVSRMRRAAEVIARIQRQTEAATEEEILAAVDSPGVPSSEAARLTSSTAIVRRYEFEMSRGEIRSESALTQTA